MRRIVRIFRGHTNRITDMVSGDIIIRSRVVNQQRLSTVTVLSPLSRVRSTFLLEKRRSEDSFPEQRLVIEVIYFATIGNSVCFSGF